MLSFTTPIDDIHSALNKAIKATKPSKLTPITEFVLLSVDASDLSLLKMTASDVENTLIITLPITKGEEGAVAINGSIFRDLLKTLSHKYTEMRFKDSGTGQAIITTSKSNTFKRSILPESEYLSISNVIHNTIFEIPTEDIKTMLDVVLHNVATTSTMALRGVYIHYDNNDLVLAATNGFKLCEARVAINIPFSQKVIADKRSLDIVYTALCAPPSNTIALDIGTSHISYMSKDLKLISMPVQEQYPEYTQFFTRPRPRQITINREELIKTLQIIMTSSGDSQLSVWTIEDNTITIVSESHISGTSKEILSVEYEDDILVIGFNTRLILDTLSSLQEDELIVHFHDETTPILIESTIRDIRIKNIIVPMRT